MADTPRIDDLRRRVQRDPASIAFAQLAEELRRAQQFQESVDTCRTGLAIHPGYLSARVTLGRALIELDKLDDAQAELQTVLKSAPENLAAIRGLGEIHHRRGELAEALAQYRAALALARNDPDLQQTVADLARQVEPPAPSSASDGLSFDQMKNELLKRASGNAAAAAAVAAPEPIAAVAPTPSAPEIPSPFPALEIIPSTDLRPIPAAAETPERAVQLVDAVLPEPDPVREHAQRTVAALEQWLDAVHAARADRRA
jgi:tetratricopeptide (TPR) repeat protein